MSYASARVKYIRHFEQKSRRVIDSPVKDLDVEQLKSGKQKYDHIICSPYLRCRQTAALFGDNIVINCEYQGSKSIKTFKLDSTTSEWKDEIPDMTETWEECANRINKHLDEVSCLEGNILVVTHGIVVNYAHEQLIASRKYKRGRESLRPAS